MKDSYGWAGKILCVDLTKATVTKKSTINYEPKKFIGGVGLNTKIFWNLGCPRVAAFDPANPLIISVGPLTGLSGPFNRAEVCSISPQCYPEELFTYSGFGGKWPSELKYAGYDGIVILGKANEPVCLSINNENVEIQDARDLWGVDTFETQKALMADDPRASVITIGPAGENLSRIAVILNETGSAAGQGGFGAVMGSKNLKAISVQGTGSVKIAKPDDFFELISGRKAKDQWLIGSAQSWGRSPLCDGKVEIEMVEKYRKKFAGAFGCPYQCCGYYNVPGVGQGAAMCINWVYGFFRQDSKAVWEAQLIFQKLGVNHFELAGLFKFIDLAMGRGILKEKELEKVWGLPILDRWGGTATDHEFLTALAYGIAEGRSPLHEGVARAIELLFKAVGKREELKELGEVLYPAWGYVEHYYGWLGLALHVATDTRDSGNSTDEYLSFGRGGRLGIPPNVVAEYFGVPGAQPTYAHPIGSEVEAVYEGIERLTFWTQCSQCLRNSLPMCNFASLPDCYFDPPEMDIRIFESKVYSAVTGIDMDVEELWRTGERIWNLYRAVMISRDGRTREEDTFTKSFFKEQWEPGDVTHLFPTARLYRDKFEAVKDRYYKLCGWDVKTGRPTRVKLEELELEDVADKLARSGLIP
jgi:aldehyde:ferredoxin oxidoreductase